MSGSLSDLEKDIEESRARLDRTIDRLQDRLSPTSLMEEMLGSARRAPVTRGVYDGALAAVRRNPLPVLLIAAGVGLLLRGMSSGGVLSGRAVPVPTPPRPDGPADALAGGLRGTDATASGEAAASATRAARP